MAEGFGDFSNMFVEYITIYRCEVIGIKPKPNPVGIKINIKTKPSLNLNKIEQTFVYKFHF